MKNWLNCIFKKQILILLFILFTLGSFLIFKPYLSVFYFQNDKNRAAINIESSDLGEIYCCANKTCQLFEFKNGVYSAKINQENPLFYSRSPIKEIEIVSKEDISKKIDSVSIFINKDLNYIKTFKSQKIIFQGNPANSIKFVVNSDKTTLQKTALYFETFFYNWYFYILSYIILIFYLSKYKPEIKYEIMLIILLAFFLRLSHIDFIPLWNDELYTYVKIASSGSGFNFINAFSDPGNPPLFFLLSNFWLYFFNKSVFLIRFLPLLISLIQIYSIYFVLDKLLNRKTALLAAFLSAINIFIILESNEIRSYILSMTLILWGFYWFYKLRENYNRKNLIIYSIISIFLINTHFYCLLYILANFISGLIIFKKNRLSFLFSNLISFLTFIPYFKLTVIDNSFSSSFNTWLPYPDLSVLLNHITFYFGNIFFFVIVIIFSFLIIKKLENKEKNIFLYIIYTIIFIFISAYLFSLLIKPVLFERYFCIFLPFLIINTSILVLRKYPNLFFNLIVFLFALNIPHYENFNLFSNIDSFMKYSLLDYKNNSEVSYFIIPDRIDYINYYPDTPKGNVIVSNLGVREDKDLLKEYLSKIPANKKVILYIPEICINSKLKYSNDINIKKIESAIMPVYKIFVN